jgi:uncharacterized protein (DUF302 family)
MTDDAAMNGAELPIVARSRSSYVETVDALSKAVLGAGSTVFAHIDQRAAARNAGLELRPTTLLIFGNPLGGTPLMNAYPLSALDLPLKLVIWEENAEVFVAYLPMTVIKRRYGITGHDALLTKLQRAVAAIASTVT